MHIYIFQRYVYELCAYAISVLGAVLVLCALADPLANPPAECSALVFVSVGFVFYKQNDRAHTHTPSHYCLLLLYLEYKPKKRFCFNIYSEGDEYMR